MLAPAVAEGTAAEKEGGREMGSGSGSTDRGGKGCLSILHCKAHEHWARENDSG